MSQIYRNPSVGGIARQPIGTLTAPGLVTPPPTSITANALDQLLGVLRSAGMAAEAGSQLARELFYDRRRVEAEQEQARREAEARKEQVRRDAERVEREAEARSNEARKEADRIEREAEILDRGLASEHASRDLPGLTAQINDRKLFTDDTPESAVASFLAAQTEGMSPAYREQYTRALQGPLIAKVYAHRENVKGEALSALKENLQRGAKTAASGASLQLFVASHQRLFPNDSEIDRLTDIVVPALNDAAASGDDQRFKAAAGLLDPQRFSAELRTAETQLQRVKNSEVSTREQDFVEGIAKQIDDLVSGKGGSYAKMLQDLDAASDEGSIRPTTILQMREKVMRMQDSQNLEAEKAIKELAKASAAREHVIAALAAGAVGNLWSVPELDDPKTGAKLSRAEIQQAATALQFEMIANRHKDQPDVVLTKQVKYVADNGITPPEEWKSMFTAGFRGVSVALSLTKPGERITPNETTLAAFVLHEKLETVAPHLLLDMPAEARKFFEMASTLRQLPEYAGKPGAALIEAARIQQLPEPPPEPTNAIIRKQVEDLQTTGFLFWQTTASNPGEIGAAIAELARIKIRAGLGAEAAVKQAAEVVRQQRTFIGNWSVSLNDARLPQGVKENIQPVAAGIFKDWVAKHGEAEGLDVDDLTLRHDRQTGLWYIASGHDGSIVRQGKPGEIAFDADGLLSRVASKHPDIDEIVKRWNARRNQPQPFRLAPGFLVPGLHGF